MDFYAFRKLMPNKGRKLYKSLLVMKLTTILIIVACIGAHAAALSQKINLDAKNVSIEEVFNVIKKQTGYHFFYEKNVLNDLPKVSVHAVNEDIASVLKDCFKTLPISFYISDNTIGIKRKVIAPAQKLSPVIVLPEQTVIKGTVTDSLGKPLTGVSVYLKGTKIGTTTNNLGHYSLAFSAQNAILVFAYIGYETQQIPVDNNATLNIILKQQGNDLEQMVVVGYGSQKKESVVAAISQTTGAVLERAGGVSSIGAALTGNVPGLITTSSTGLPGEEDPNIVIRGNNSWNNSSPLILVDGVERPMNSVDINSVATVTVLKDASATAVFGSRGANGVILITTKRGQLGKAAISAKVNTIMKQPSKLPQKYDSYNTLKLRNQVIENELNVTPDSWNKYLPQAILDKYRNPVNEQDKERYPNVDWNDVLFKDYTMSQNASVDISGGTKFVKYFANVDYLHEGDIFKVYDNGRGYKPGFGFNRINVRSNLDFQLTPTTIFKTNLSGSYGVQKTPWNFSQSDYVTGLTLWLSAYSTPPDAFLPIYPDGSWGFSLPNSGLANSALNISVGGIQQITTARMTTDFILDQDLRMITKGLKVSGTVSLDNTFIENNRGINDLYNGVQMKYVDPETGAVTYKQAYDGVTDFDFQQGINWSTSAGNVGSNYRRIFYQLQLNYSRTFARDHYFTAMGLMNRNQYATGSEVPHSREDWVFRTTYSYKNKYTIEYNGAYNGSEQFAKGNRFAYFSSGGVNWVVSKEKFMQSLDFIDVFKIRASIGQTGNDNINNLRWLYLDQWAHTGNALLGTSGVDAEPSTYTWYSLTSLGNAKIQWEQSFKSNIGVDFELFHGLLKGKFDYFEDKRTKIFIAGSNRSVPSYFGFSAPAANLGKVNAKGYEFELHLNKSFNDAFRVYIDFNMSHTVNKVIEEDDAELLPDYQKKAGKSVGQAYSYVSAGYYNTWDELYESTPYNTNDVNKLPGDYNIIDYNADGVIDQNDNIPYGYTGWPQNTYNTTVGFDWKGFSAFVQFYGVTNVTRQVVFGSLVGQVDIAYEEGSYWSKAASAGTVPLPRWLSTPPDYYRADQYMFDGSYLRLKNAEIAYTFGKTWNFIKKAGLENIRVYLNGDNLLLWTKMPDDRESNFAGSGWASQGAYPTLKRYNLGFNITF